MKVDIKICLSNGRYFYILFRNTSGCFYYTESGQRNYMDYGGNTKMNQTQIRRLGKWWEKMK